MDYIPKEIEQNVNVTPVHPLRYLAKVGGILAFWGIVLYWLTGAIADQLTTVLDPQLEAKIGKSLVAPLASQAVRPKVEQKLQTLLDQIQAQQNSRLPKAQIHLIDADEINAAALPGGQIIITTGLLDQANSENELAFVLAHELGHHQLRHPLRGLGRSLLWIMVLSVVGVGQQTPTVLTQTEPLTRTLVDLQFSRAQEQASDQYALATIHARYGHVNHALDFFQRLENKQRDALSQSLQIEFFSTHPFPKTRIQDLQRYARKQKWPLVGAKTPLEQ